MNLKTKPMNEMAWVDEKQLGLPKKYWQLLWPLLVEQLFLMLIGNVNVYLISIFNDQAVAATGLADQILSIGTMAMGIVSLGSTVLFLQNADESRISYIRGAVRQSLVLNVLLAFGLLMVSLFFGSTLMTWIQTPKELHGMAVSYLQIVSVSLVFQGLTTTSSSVLRSFGKVQAAMRISIINTLLTIAGNAIVILSPVPILGGGVIGIALATVITRAIGAILSILTVRSQVPQVWQGVLQYKMSDWAIGRRILELGIPSGMENVSYNFSQTVITGVIASLGAVSVTSKIYTQTITAVVFTISVACGQAAQIIIGRLVRHRMAGKAKQFGVNHALLFIGSSAILNLIIALLGPLLVGIFTKDPAIMTLTRTLLWMNIFYDPTRVANEILIAQLQVTGDVRYPVMIGLLTTYLFTVPAALIVTGVFGFGIQAVWLIFILDEGTRAYLFYRRWASGKWEKHLKITEEGETAHD